MIAVEYESLVKLYPFDRKLQRLSQKGSINLLDIGCGTAIFPSYLDRNLSENVHFACTLLDSSKASLEQAAGVLDALEHFSVDRKVQSLIEDIPSALPGSRGAYDVIWAIHSFTTVDVQRMEYVYEHLLDSLAVGGYLYVYQLAAGSAYQKLHKRYRAQHPNGKTISRFMEYEDTKRILDSIGLDYEVVELIFHHEISDSRPDLLEKYLRKCILDDSVDVQSIFHAELEEFYEQEQSQYRFPQSVNFVVVGT